MAGAEEPFGEPERTHFPTPVPGDLPPAVAEWKPEPERRRSGLRYTVQQLRALQVTYNMSTEESARVEKPQGGQLIGKNGRGLLVANASHVPSPCCVGVTTGRTDGTAKPSPLIDLSAD